MSELSEAVETAKRMINQIIEVNGDEIGCPALFAVNKAGSRGIGACKTSDFSRITKSLLVKLKEAEVNTYCFFFEAKMSAISMGTNDSAMHSSSSNDHSLSPAFLPEATDVVCLFAATNGVEFERWLAMVKETPDGRKVGKWAKLPNDAAALGMDFPHKW